MSKPRQKSISVTPKEKNELEKAKRLYEKHTKEPGDWGRFLGAVTILGLASLGIYKLVNSSRHKPVTKCAVCGRKFSIAYSEDLPTVVYVTCPHCGAELVVDFGIP